MTLYDEDYDQAIEHLKKSLAITNEIWDVNRHFRDHPYWDMHLIGNVYLNSGRPDEAKAWYDKGFELAKSTLTEGRPLRSIRSDYNSFSRGRFPMTKNNITQVKKFISDKENPVFLLAEIFMKENQPDNAINVLKDFWRESYLKQYMIGEAYLAKGDKETAKRLFEEVLNYHQVGDRFWQYEYVFISKKAKKYLIQIENQRI